MTMPAARLRPHQLMFAARPRYAPVAAACGGRPAKNEQPRNNAGFTPSAITSPGPHAAPSTQIRQGDAAHPDSRSTPTTKTPHVT
jgi:hypothetical protein